MDSENTSEKPHRKMVTHESEGVTIKNEGVPIKSEGVTIENQIVDMHACT